MQVVVPDGKEASANLAVAGDADAAAMPAEGMRDRCDDSDFADAVIEAITAGGLRMGVRNFDERPVLGYARQNFVECHNGRGRPDAVFFERHELDEADDDAFFAGEHSEGDDLVFVEATQEDAVDLDRP